MVQERQSPDTTTFFLAFQSLVKQAVQEALSEQIKENPKEETVRPPANRQEAAKYLTISLPTLDTLIRTEQIKAYRIGRQVRINWYELERYVKEGGR